MAKFCPNCGRPLEEGEVCNCTGEAAPEASVESAPAKENNAKKALNGFIPFFKEYFADPVGTTKKAVENKDMANTIVAAAAFALANFLMLFFGCRKLVDGLTDIASLVSDDKVDISVPFISFLLYSVIAAAVVLAFFALGIFVVSKIAKKEISFMDAVVAVCVNSVLPTCGLLATLLLMYVSFTLGLIVAIVCGALTVVLFAVMTVKVFDIDLTGLMIIWLAVFFLLANVCGAYISGKLDVAAVKTIEVEDIKIGDMLEGFEDTLDELKDMDPEEILEELIYDLF